MGKYLKNHYDLISLSLLALLSPLFVFPREKWNWVLLAGVAAIFLGRWFFERKLIPYTPINVAMALLVVWALFGMRGANVVASGASKITGLSFGIVCFYVLTGALGSIFRIKIVIMIFIAMSIVISLVGTLSRFDGSSVPQIDNNKIVKSIPKAIIKFERAESGINPNPLGGTLLLFIPLEIMALAILIKKNREAGKRTLRYSKIVGVAVILGLEIFALLYSRSYGAITAFGFILLMIGKKRRHLKVYLSLTALLVSFFIIKSPTLNKNVFIKSTRESLHISALVRRPIWEGGLEAARRHPVFGLGMDRLRMTPPFKYSNVHAHNQFIHLAAEMGIPALIAYLAILIGVGWMTIEVTRSMMPEWMILVMRGLAWGQIGFAVFGIADAIPLGAKPGIFFWISLALMVSIYLFGKENKLLNNNSKPLKAIG